MSYLTRVEALTANRSFMQKLQAKYLEVEEVDAGWFRVGAYEK